MQNLALITELPEIAQLALKAEDAEGLSVGDIFIKDNKITKVTGVFWDEERYQKNPEKVDGYNFRIKYIEAKDWDCTEWKDESSSNLFDFSRYYLGIKLDPKKSIRDYITQARDVIEGKISLEVFKDNSSDNVDSNTSLISKNSKEALMLLHNDIMEKKNRAELVRAFVGMEMERRKQELDKIRQNLFGVVEVFQKKLKKIMQVITTIELYLGIDEELFQIQEGTKAPQDTPISFRQAVLYMDEEIGHWQKGGLDFQNIDWFDKWLVEDDNYKRLLPEEKGMVVFRPRRYVKNYGQNDFYATAKNDENMYNTYLLIRNGENLYRVYTEKIIILPRLFPKREELSKLMEQVDDEMKKGSFYRDAEKAQEKVEDLFYQYKKRAVLMQGLIDRTDLFHPLPAEKINIFNMDELGDKVQFIYDDEMLLPSGRQSFQAWKKEINSKIGRGSRVVLTGTYPDYSRRDIVEERTTHRSVSIPAPAFGVYEVETEFVKKQGTLPHYYMEELEEKGLLVSKGKQVNSLGSGYPDHASNHQPLPGVQVRIIWTDEKDPFDRDKFRGYVEAYECEYMEEQFSIMYNPKDKVYGGWGDYWKEPSERKKRIRFRIYNWDEFVLNYDQISLDDINFYMTSRVDRPNYLSMMPVLELTKKMREQEMEGEYEFMNLLFHQNIVAARWDDLKSRIEDSVEWWKFKNMWKRPIDKDDALAFRMISKRINSKNYKFFKTE